MSWKERISLAANGVWKVVMLRTSYYLLLRIFCVVSTAALETPRKSFFNTSLVVYILHVTVLAAKTVESDGFCSWWISTFWTILNDSEARITDPCHDLT